MGWTIVPSRKTELHLCGENTELCPFPFFGIPMPTQMGRSKRLDLFSSCSEQVMENWYSMPKNQP